MIRRGGALVRWVWCQATRFVRAWDREAWKLVILSIPFVRGLLYLVHLAPPQLNDEVIRPPWQMIALLTLAVAALLGMVGVIGNHLVTERLGMHILGPLSVLYGFASAVSDWHRGLVTLVVYLMIAACCFRRARKITLHLRWVNQMLIDAAANRAATT